MYTLHYIRSYLIMFVIFYYFLVLDVLQWRIRAWADRPGAPCTIDQKKGLVMAARNVQSSHFNPLLLAPLLYENGQKAFSYKFPDPHLSLGLLYTLYRRQFATLHYQLLYFMIALILYLFVQ